MSKKFKDEEETKILLLSDQLTKSVLDPIHGLIRMTEEEMQIISHPLFNRLRRIKQNSFLYYVFPSANHTRFEHSIGVMYLASDIFLNCLNNAVTVVSKQTEGNNIHCNILTRAHFKNDSEIEELYFDLRIAALLHDTGHGPFSHLFDNFAPINRIFLDLIKYDSQLNSYNTDFGEELARAMEIILYKNKKIEGQVEHEYVSYYFTVKILSELKLPINRIRRILTIMNTELNLFNTPIMIEGKEYSLLPLLSQIVAGAPLDCDRMDYLLRDSYFTGVKYGTYDLNRILKSVLPFIDQNKQEVRLGIKKSGLPAIENFLQARYELYIQVYFHKTNRACNAMLEKATKRLKDNKKVALINCNTPKDFVQSYLSYSDESFLDRLERELTDSDDKNTLIDLKNRRIWKRLIEIFPGKNQRREGDIQKKLDNIEQAILARQATLKPFIQADLIKNYPLKDLDFENDSVILTKDIDGNYQNIDEKNSWLEESIIFKALSKQYLIGRMYISRSVDSELYNQLKTIVSMQ